MTNVAYAMGPELSLIAVATSYLLDNVIVKATKLTRLVCVAVRA